MSESGQSETIKGPLFLTLHCRFTPDLGRPYFQAAGAFLLQKRGAAALKFEASAYVFAILGLLVSRHSIETALN